MKPITIELNNISPHVRHAQYVQCPVGTFRVQNRIIYDYELYFIVEGNIRVIEERNEYVLKPGDIHFMKPFVQHERAALSDSGMLKYYSAHFDLLYHGKTDDFSALDEYVTKIEKREAPDARLFNRQYELVNNFTFPAQYSLADKDKLAAAFEILVNDYKLKKTDYSTLELKKDMLEIINLIHREINVDKIEISSDTSDRIVTNSLQTLIEKIEQYLKNGYSQEIDIGEVARKFNMSPSYMRRLFKAIYGRSPMEYVTDLRIENAKKLLLLTDYKIAYIANIIGYNDFFYFSRIFKKYTGLSPNTYRRSRISS